MSTEPTTARGFYDQGLRLAALRKHADAADAFSQCLELLREELAPQDGAAKEGEDQQQQVEDDPKLAPVLHKYGRELLNNAIANAFTVAGKGGAGKASLPSKVTLPSTASDGAPAAAAAAGSSNGAAASSSSSSAAPAPAGAQCKLISFSGDDAQYDEDDEDDDDEDDGDKDGEDEDDMETAFAALDVARQLYEHILSSSPPNNASLQTFDGSTLTSPELANQLANVLADLGELHLESETFIQAAEAFQAALDVLIPVVDPASFSRRLAEAHFQLGLALEYHPEGGKKEGALEHLTVTRALLVERRGAVVERRDTVSEKETEMANVAGEVPNGESANGKGKGKGKAVETALLAEDDVRGLSKERATRELGEIDELIKDIDSKIEELQGSVANGGANDNPAKDAVRQAIDEAFHGGASKTDSINPFSGKPSAPSAPANDLTTLVKKKKKPAAAAADEASKSAITSAAGKRKADGVEAGSDGAAQAGLGSEESSVKRARVESALPGEE
ncbi:unnamed protein product [Tilletia controversa]|nr:unnamed protein product [Tilletia controversa]